MKLTGNTILVTGGTSGIGRALAQAFHSRGNRVVVAGRRQHLLDEIARQHPGIEGLRVDLDDPSSTEHLAREVRSRFGDLNVLIANAGISRAEDLAGSDGNAADAEAIVQTNILGVLRASHAVLPVLRQQANATLMATSSALAFVPRADFPTYCASKAFLHSWLVSLRHQLRHLPVEVLELSPPYVQTELTGAQQAADPRAMPIGEYVQAVMQILERGEHARGEILLERDLPRRWAERDGRYDAVFAALNPG